MNSTNLISEIMKDPSIIDTLDEDKLMEIRDRLNPYSQVVDDSEVNSKYVVMSYQNVSEESMKKYKTISWLKFLKQVMKESDSWVDEFIGKDDKEPFVKYMNMFVDKFLTYNPKHHVSGKEGDIPHDFIHKWQRYEDMHRKGIEEYMKEVYPTYYHPYLYTLQIYDCFDKESDAHNFVDKHNQATGLDMIVAKTNKWVIPYDSEDTLDKTKFVHDDDNLLNSIIEQMKSDASMGEKMIKKRIDAKKSQQETIDNKDELNQVTSQFNDAYKQRKVQLASFDEGEEEDIRCPLVVNDGKSIQKSVI